MGWSAFFRRLVYLYLRDREGFEREFSKINDPIVKKIAEAYTLGLRSEVQAMIRKAKSLLSEAPQELLTFVFEILGTGYRMIGEPEMSIYYYNKAIALAEDEFQKGRLYFHLGFLRYSLGDLWGVAEILTNFKDLAEREESVLPWYNYLASIKSMALGDFQKALHFAEATQASPSVARYALEIKGMALRGMGRLEEAAEALIKETEEFLGDYNAYATVPLSKVVEMELFQGPPAPHDLVEEALSMSPKGKGLSEKAGIMYLKALLRRSPEAILRAADALLKSLQPYEAMAAYITAAWLAYQAESPAFFRACKGAAGLGWLSAAFENDALFGRFYREVMLPLISYEAPSEARGIRARLLGGLEIEVDGRCLDWRSWRNKKALQVLVYLLLSHAHALSAEELARMLWPEESDPKRRLHRLQTAVSFLRRQLANPRLLNYQEGFYVLGEVHTDLEELFGALQRAEREPGAAQEALRRWAGAELLPGWEDDYIRSHRKRLQEAFSRVKEFLQL